MFVKCTLLTIQNHPNCAYIGRICGVAIKSLYSCNLAAFNCNSSNSLLNSNRKMNKYFLDFYSIPATIYEPELFSDECITLRNDAILSSSHKYMQCINEIYIYI